MKGLAALLFIVCALPAASMVRATGIGLRARSGDLPVAGAFLSGGKKKTRAANSGSISALLGALNKTPCMKTSECQKIGKDLAKSMGLKEAYDKISKHVTCTILDEYGSIVGSMVLAVSRNPSLQKALGLFAGIGLSKCGLAGPTALKPESYADKLDIIRNS